MRKGKLKIVGGDVDFEVGGGGGGPRQSPKKRLISMESDASFCKDVISKNELDRLRSLKDTLNVMFKDD